MHFLPCGQTVQSLSPALRNRRTGCRRLGLKRRAWLEVSLAQWSGWSWPPIYPPRAGFRPGRLSGRESRAEGTGCTSGPVPIRRVPDRGQPAGPDWHGRPGPPTPLSPRVKVSAGCIQPCRSLRLVPPTSLSAAGGASSPRCARRRFLPARAPTWRRTRCPARWVADWAWLCASAPAWARLRRWRWLHPGPAK